MAFYGTRPWRIAHRHRLHAAPLLGPARGDRPAPLRRRRSRTRSRCEWDIDRLEPEQRRACVRETHSETRILGRRALPGRRRDGRAPGTRPATSSTSPRIAPATPTTPPSAGCDRIGLPYDELYCSYDKVTRCREIGIDVLIDDSPDNLQRRGRGRHHAGDARCTRGTARCARRRTSSAARTGRSSPAASSRCSHEQGSCPPPAATDLRDYLPGDRARPPGHRLGPLGARRGPARQDARTSSSTTTGSAARSRGSSTCRPPAARCSSPTTPARCRPTRR